jgi:formylglycine-generating enzyme required for sulfatase activity
MQRADHGRMDSGSNSAAVSWLGAFTWSALRSVCWLALVCAAFAGCDSRAAVEEHTKETIRLLAEAKQRADALGSEPKDIPELQRWLREWEPLLQRLPVVEAQLEPLLERATPKLDGNLKIEGYEFASEAEEKQAKALHELMGYLQDFGSAADPSHGLCGSVRRTIKAAEAAAEEAARQAAAAAAAYRSAVAANPQAWPAAIDAIAKSDRYGGMKLREHEGLLPIGMDPESKLWEFVHVASGTPGKSIPARDPATGRIVPDGDMGFVLVLLPGGTFWMGAQQDDASKPNYDPQAHIGEGPVHQVTLSPFFVGKHEVTQGQWLRWTGNNPSSSRDRNEPTLPVTNVSWNDVDAAARKAGLLLPTEAQWEYACRAGSSTPWWTGAEEDDLAKGAVFGGAKLAPVGSKVANRFGLFDTAGNVWEWCRDADGDYPSSIVADPLVVSGPNRVFRGGGWGGAAGGCRSAFRYGSDPGVTGSGIGFRVVLAPVLVQ